MCCFTSMDMEYQHIDHPFSPVYDERSRILILGTLPSVKSRENQFYYGHPQNRFWRVLARLFDSPLPQTESEKRALLIRNHVALWDVIQSCDIQGSSDSSIRNVVPTNLNMILSQTNILRIYANGSKAAVLYQKYQFPLTETEIIPLPSTSPANASWNLERLTEAWSVILK